MFIFTPLFTIFVVLSGGYIAKLLGVLKQRQSQTFLNFTITFAIPCLIFNGIYHLKLDFSFIALIFMGFCVCICSGLIASLMGYFFKFSKATIISMFLLASFGNTLFVGIPIISGIYGTDTLGQVVLYDALATGLPVSLLAPFIIALGNTQKTNALQILKRILSFPPFIALALGFLLKPFTLPEILFAPIALLGNSAIPIALFAIGLSLGFNTIKSAYKSAIIVIFCKTLLAPFILIGILCITHTELSKDMVIIILESSMPTMVLAGAVVMQAKLDSNLAVSAIAFGILAAFFTIPLLCAILL